MHACLHGMNARVTGNALQTIHTALLSSDDMADEFPSSGSDDDDAPWVDVH